MIELKRMEYDKLEMVTKSVFDQFRVINLLKELFGVQFNVVTNEFKNGKIYCILHIPEEESVAFTFQMMSAMNFNNLEEHIKFTDLAM
jgi:hypothetical protein